MPASINPSEGRFLTLNAGGLCSLKELGVSTARFNYISKVDYSGAYTINGGILELQMEKE